MHSMYIFIDAHAISEYVNGHIIIAYYTHLCCHTVLCTVNSLIETVLTTTVQ